MHMKCIELRHHSGTKSCRQVARKPLAPQLSRAKSTGGESGHYMAMGSGKLFMNLSEFNDATGESESEEARDWETYEPG